MKLIATKEGGFVNAERMLAWEINAKNTVIASSEECYYEIASFDNSLDAQKFLLDLKNFLEEKDG